MDLNFVDTPRLRLLMIDPALMRHVYLTYDDTRLMEFLGLESQAELEREKDKFSKGLTTFNRSFLYFHLLDKTDGRFKGRCGFHTVYSEHHRAELFYMLKDEADKRQGLMSEALAAVLDYGFRVMKLHRIEALTATYNSASQALLKKFCFVREGQLREHYFVEGKAEDSLIFSLLKSEFNPAASH